MHIRSESSILYFGTPVVLISTVNEDGSYNLAPMSSAWWLGWRCMLGLAASSKTTENLLRTGECVLNLPSADQVDCVDAIARTTGSSPVPLSKAMRGYSTVREKFQAAGLTPTPSEIVAAPRALGCPVQMETSLAEAHPVAADAPVLAGFALKIEVSIERQWQRAVALAQGRDENGVHPRGHGGVYKGSGWVPGHEKLAIVERGRAVGHERGSWGRIRIDRSRNASSPGNSRTLGAPRRPAVTIVRRGPPDPRPSRASPSANHQNPHVPVARTRPASPLNTSILDAATRDTQSGVGGALAGPKPERVSVLRLAQAGAPGVSRPVRSGTGANPGRQPLEIQVPGI
jgi:flavin reductase (DIM6/NTAB) family NADH-FMN oxidoreductase RutF